MDQCLQALFGSLSFVVLFAVSEALPFIKRIDGDSLTHLIINYCRKLRDIYKEYKTSLSHNDQKSDDLIFASNPDMYV